MAEFDEKLNAILSNQNAMNQIMELAHSLSGDGGGDGGEAPQPEAEPEETGGAAPDLQSMLGALDPEIIRKGVQLVSEAGSSNKNGTALMNALRPYLKETHQAKLDRAMQLARTTHLIRTAISAIGGKGADRDV